MCVRVRTPLPFLWVTVKRWRVERRNATPGKPLCVVWACVYVWYFFLWCSPSTQVAPRQLLLRLLFISRPQCPPAPLPLRRCLASWEKEKAEASSTRRVQVCVEKGGEAPSHGRARRGTEREGGTHDAQTRTTAARERARRHTQEADLFKHPHSHKGEPEVVVGAVIRYYRSSKSKSSSSRAVLERRSAACFR